MNLIFFVGFFFFFLGLLKYSVASKKEKKKTLKFVMHRNKHHSFVSNITLLFIFLYRNGKLRTFFFSLLIRSFSTCTKYWKKKNDFFFFEELAHVCDFSVDSLFFPIFFSFHSFLTQIYLNVYSLAQNCVYGFSFVTQNQFHLQTMTVYWKMVQYSTV